MEFEKNAKTHGKLMDKIFVHKKNVVMHIFIEPVWCDTFFNNFVPGICLNFVMEKITFVMENSSYSWKKTHSGVGTLL